MRGKTSQTGRETWKEFIGNFHEFKTPSGRFLYLLGEAEKHGIYILAKQDSPAIIDDVGGVEVVLYLPGLPTVKFREGGDGRVSVEVVS